MALSSECNTFYESWLTKANDYSIDSLTEAFDRFFTLYVVFNRLYAEAAFRLARRGLINFDSRDRFPDSKASQEYLLQYLGASALIDALEGHEPTRSALESMRHLLRQGHFAFKLDIVTGVAQPDCDRELLSNLESRNRSRRAKAVLEMLYAIRCNMFHGHKGFEPLQLEVLRPTTVLLEKTIRVVYEKLRNDGG